MCDLGNGLASMKKNIQKYFLTVGAALLNEVKLGEVHHEKNIYRIKGEDRIVEMEGYGKCEI